MGTKAFGPLNHFDYERLDRECTCSVCMPWRASHQNYTAVLVKIESHPRSCMCEECREGYKARSEYLAHMNRRDLYCESSFHASLEPTLGPAYMAWLGREMADKKTKPDGWWEIQAPALPMQAWFRRFHHHATTAMTAVSGMVSGMARIQVAA